MCWQTDVICVSDKTIVLALILPFTGTYMMYVIGNSDIVFKCILVKYICGCIDVAFH